MSYSGRVFLGIDLGTTNSSVARVRVTKVKKEVLLINMVKIKTSMEDGSHSNKELIPSVVYFPQGESPVVGYRAKAMIQYQPSRVIKSIKTSMGSPSWKRTFDNQDYKPVDIATIILKHLMRGIKKHYDRSIDDIVITVPASFDMDMRADTLEAAKRAGIKTEDDDGTPREILLDEPYACLLDFIEQQRRGEIDFVDFSNEKVVLVYDLGGGTLDVSIHGVQTEPDNPFPNIKDLGISRYTHLGGDVIDEYLTEFLFKEYLRKNNMFAEKYSQLDVNEAKVKLIEKVEQWKKEVTSRAEERLLDDPTIDILSISDKILAAQLLDMKNLSRKLTINEYKEILSEFMVEDIKFPTKGTIENPLSDELNLISPILDVLQKAYKKTGKILNPDLIILSGGMTRVQIIQDRIMRFFVKDVHVIPDPDRAVSRGAAIYHYYMHKGYKPKSIIAESILIKVKESGGKKTTLEELVPSGASLPYFGEFSFVVGEDGRKSIRMPFFRTDLRHKLIDRTFILETPSKKDMEIKANVNVDARKIVTFTAWLAEDPKQKVIVEIDPSSPEPSKKERKSLKKKEPQKIVLKPSSQKKFSPRVIDEVFSRINKNQKAKWKQYSQMAVVNAQNVDELVEYALKKLKQKKGSHQYQETAKTRLVCDFLGKVVISPYNHQYFSHTLFQIQKSLMDYVTDIGTSPNFRESEIHQRVRYAIETIGKISLIDERRDVVEFFKDILKRAVFYKIRSPIFISLGKLKPDDEIVQILLSNIKSSSYILQEEKKGLLLSLLWALGRQAQRKVDEPVGIEQFLKILPDIYKILKKINIPETIIHATYCIVEICSSCPDIENEAPEEMINEALIILQKKRTSLKGTRSILDLKKRTLIKRNMQAINWLEMGMRFLKREETSDDEATLLELREKMSS